MAIVQLTDRRLQSLTADAPQVDFWDQGLPGFGVRVSSRGRKSFIVMYRAGTGKKRMTLGTYPAMGLADARQRAKEVLHKAMLGEDPQAQKMAVRKADRFEQLAADYLEHHAKPKKKRWAEDARIIDKTLMPAWKGRVITEISRRDVIEVLDTIAKRGAPIMANRVRALVSKMFNFGIGRDLVQHNPCLGVPRPGKERQRDRVLGEEEISALWRGFDDLGLVMAASFKMRLITAQRGIEVLSMRWQDIGGDWWTQPATATKNGLAHRVPLTPQAQAILDQLRPHTGGSTWVFASPRKPNAPIQAVMKAAERLAKATGIDFVPHDLRRTAASWMTSMGVSRLVVAKILNHVESGITAVYDRHSYDIEKREALTRWGSWLEKLVGKV